MRTSAYHSLIHDVTIGALDAPPPTVAIKCLYQGLYHGETGMAETTSG
jgi:hypothetical protein